MITYFSVIVRNLTEWTAGNPSLCIDQGTITDGIGNNTIGMDNGGTHGVLNTRANVIQGCAFGRDNSTSFDFSDGRGLVGIQNVEPAGVLTTGSSTFPGFFGGTVAPFPAVNIPGVAVTRRYQIQLALGLLTQEKLIPTKYMASQLAIELTLVFFILLTKRKIQPIVCLLI